MDRNKVKSITNITDKLHEETDNIYENLMDENHEKASDSIDIMIESLKHLKTNLKEDEI